MEIERGTLSRWSPRSGVSVVAEVGGGPNGAALGPEGAVYICNNGGFEWFDLGDTLLPGDQAADYTSGRIDRVELATGGHDVLYTQASGHALSGPNDIVFDRQGCFWFTDLGKSRSRDKDHGGVFYADPSGSQIETAVYPLDTPNGIGLSADEATLYVAQTIPRCLLAFDIETPGNLAPQDGLFPGRAVGGQAPDHLLDSMALLQNGQVCVGTLVNGGITIFDPDTGTHDFCPTPDMMATNICFGGADMRTAYITCSTTGQLLRTTWPVAGQKLNFSGW